MLLLAADTSGKHGSIALVRGDTESLAVLEVVPLTGGTFSAQLVPHIAELLGRHGVSKRDLNGFVVTSGPGSFTGLRVGLAAIKGLAEVLNKPIVAISRLEVLAASASVEGMVVAALDAGRGQVYAGGYEVATGQARLEQECLLNEEEFVALVRGRSARVVTPDKLVMDWGQKHGFEALLVEHPRSDALACIGVNKLLAGETVAPAELEANYIRRSDAEIFSKQ